MGRSTYTGDNTTKARLRAMVKKFLRDETGLEVSEYAIGTALILITLLTVYRLFGTVIIKQIESLGTSVSR